MLNFPTTPDKLFARYIHKCIVLDVFLSPICITLCQENVCGNFMFRCHDNVCRGNAT